MSDVAEVQSKLHELFGPWRRADGLEPVLLPAGMNALSDRHCHTRLVATAAGDIAMVLPAPPNDEHQLFIKNIGAGNVAITASLDGAVTTTVVASLGVLRLEWSTRFETWLVV